MRFWPFSKTPVETKSFDLATWSDEIAALFGIVTSASTGMAVTGAAALKVPAVQSAVRVISESAASLRAMVEVYDGTRWAPDPTHKIQTDIIEGEVNAWTDWFTFVRDLVAECQISDAGGLAWVNRTGEGVAEIVKFDTGLIKVERANTGQPKYEIESRPLDAADVIHMRGPFTRSPVSLAAEAIGLALLLEKHTGTFFKNGARPSGTLESPKPLGDEGVKKMLAAWKASQSGADNAGKTPVLWDGTTYKPQSFNSVDSQLLELRKFAILEIARAFRVPPTMLWDLDRATWSNTSQLGREFLVYCLEPQLLALEGAMRRGLFTPDERKTHRIRFERDDLTRADLGERATAYSSLISARVLNPNEAREWEGLPPYDGGDQFANPNTGSNQAGAAAPQEPKQ